VSAASAYRLIFKRSGWAPAFLADPGRIDHLEVVDVDSGEVVLFWDCRPSRAAKMARALRADLESLDAREFLARWSTVDGP
jgi:hypothetical protein